jgi:hypothetical protein
MMAEMVAGEKKGDNSDSDSDDGGNGAGDVTEVPGGRQKYNAVLYMYIFCKSKSFLLFLSTTT